MDDFRVDRHLKGCIAPEGIMHQFSQVFAIGSIALELSIVFHLPDLPACRELTVHEVSLIEAGNNKLQFLGSEHVGNAEYHRRSTKISSMVNLESS